MRNIKSKITICLFLNIFLVNYSGNSQHLSYNDLLSLYKNNTEQSEELFNKKGFVFKNSEKDGETKSDIITWFFKKPGSRDDFSNEYFFKECSSLFMNHCEKVSYYMTDAIHFGKLKSSMKLNFYKFLYSNTNNNGVLSHYYLIAGPIEVRFCTIPRSGELGTKVFAVELRKIEFTEEKK